MFFLTARFWGPNQPSLNETHMERSWASPATIEMVYRREEAIGPPKRVMRLPRTELIGYPKDQTDKSLICEDRGGLGGPSPAFVLVGFREESRFDPPEATIVGVYLSLRVGAALFHGHPSLLRIRWCASFDI